MTGILKVNAYVSVSGPLADGKAGQAIEDFTRAAGQAIADEAARRLREFNMDKTGRSTGAFAAHVEVKPRGADFSIPAPMEKGVTWGPWLEGTSKRNSSTGFRGYGLFRKTAASLDLEATAIAERILPEYLPRMGGAA